MQITEIGTDGRMRVVPITGEVESFVVDAVYAAIGAEAEEPWKSLAYAGERLCLSHSRTYSGEKYGIPFVVGGDLVNREESVADAIASGKEAAIALDAYWQGGLSLAAAEVDRCRIGDGNALSMEIYCGGPRRNRSGHVVRYDEINPDSFEHSQPKSGFFLPADVSSRSFDEIEAGLDADTAVRQAERCFQCGICNDCDHCRTFCPELAVLVTTETDRNPSAISGSDRRILADYCKGCGICVTECPRNAMLMEESEA
jgi:Pyruvate/2-oxoacid:ferredoxin oxidoreductase delta subunit